MSAPAVYTLPPDKLAAAIHLSHAEALAYFGGTAWLILALWLLVRLRAGWRISRWLTLPSPWLQGLVVTPAWLLILAVLGLPESILMHRVYRSLGLSVEGWGAWFGDVGKSAALTLIFGTLILSVVYALMRRFPRWWWLWLWLLTIPVEIAAVYAVPIFIDPLFNHFTPLAQSDPALVGQLERVAARGHLYIPPSRMFVMDASRKVTGPNAYVTGFGASKRIVVWDTTLRELPPDDILATYGHEQGHYVLRHIQKGLIFSLAVTLVFFWIASILLRGLVRRYGYAWHIHSIDDWSSLGMILLVAALLGFFAAPISNAFSRHIEHQADVYGEEVIHGLVADPQTTMAESFQRLGELWLDNPRPNRFVVFWTYSHPLTAERMLFAAEYDPWRPGSHPRYLGR
jgi:STE24 endopeptidase